MELDQTIVYNEELDYWCKEFPNLHKSEVAEILLCIEINQVKEEYWKENPTLPEETVNSVVASNAAASYEYHLYRELNNEAP